MGRNRLCDRIDDVSGSDNRRFPPSYPNCCFSSAIFRINDERRSSFCIVSSQCRSSIRFFADSSCWLMIWLLSTIPCNSVISLCFDLRDCFISLSSYWECASSIFFIFWSRTGGCFMKRRYTRSFMTATDFLNSFFCTFDFFSRR